MLFVVLQLPVSQSPLRMGIHSASRHRREGSTRATPSAPWTTRWGTPAPRCHLCAPSSTPTTRTRGGAARGTRLQSPLTENQKRKEFLKVCNIPNPLTISDTARQRSQRWSLPGTCPWCSPQIRRSTGLAQSAR